MGVIPLSFRQPRLYRVRSGIASWLILAQQRKRQQRERGCEVIGDHVRVTRGHLGIAVFQDALQGQKAAATHHAMTGERMPQNMRQLARRV